MALYGDEARPRMGFFTDTSVCIGCKACEVACKEWNRVPAAPHGFTGDSLDNTSDLDADHWRHVAFVEQRVEADPLTVAATGLQTYQGGDGMRWLMASDVCKHCTHAACLEVCPTGALFRTEYGTSDRERFAAPRSARGARPGQAARGRHLSPAPLTARGSALSTSA